ncbi:ROK family protein [Ferruginibacter albus]|uniref:ROK family protein n=1 Tax=Ferruginibacter albus TaxID=2875540 RepID=UPI001CC7DE8D|nr:ROK family protein [Ferruginibacter albus]UAY51928.1 ROK family protein [Ferruginibacter albus]
MNNVVTGIDIGGTHITVCKIDLNTMEMLEASRFRSDIDTSESKEHVIEAWSKAIKGCSFLDDGEIGKVGIALPGPFDYEKGISLITGLNKYESLYGLNVKELLSKELNIPVTDIRMMNDATAFLLGEWKAGSGKGCKNIVGLTLGTGLGSANCFDNVMEDGDLWKMPFGDSRAEDLLCARWFIKEYEKRTQKHVANVKELSLMVGEGIVASQLFKEFGHTLGEVLIKRYSNNFPEHIIIGGNIARSWNLFYPYTKAALQRHGFFPNIIPATLGEDAALMGAACLWRD